MEQQVVRFPALAGKKVFLTGGTGFFGQSILDLLNDGWLPETEFTILSRHPERFLAGHPEFSRLSRVRFLAGDVRDFVFPAEKFDCVIHAATPAVTTLPPGEMREIILDGMSRVLRFAAKCGAERMLFTSSGAVYGPQAPEVRRISETCSCRPVTEYGIAKLEAEVMGLRSGIDLRIARCFAFVGPRLNRDIHFAIGNFMRDALKGDDIVIRGDGTPYRSYLYADDLVEWLFTILDRGKPGRAYNVGSPEEISIADLARRVAAGFSPAPAVRVLGVPRAGAVPERYVPDVSRAEAELGLRVRVPLDEAIARSCGR
ncbi:MAG: NAD(P)-dependent oxidoreductase [Lentisphaeria bacterium]|nr:NAD(P)-dependent oxidoreductase [Lentisphaeria bacterium]